MKSELLVIVFHLFGFVLFMKGLFPYSSSTPNIANRSCFDNQGIFIHSSSSNINSFENLQILM